MAKKGKRYSAALASFDKEKQYEVKEAMDVLMGMAKAKFDETIEAHIKPYLKIYYM